MIALFNDLKVIKNNIQNKKRHENNKTLDTHLNDKNHSLNLICEPTKQVELVFITSIMKSHENAHVTRMINNKTYEYGHVLGVEDNKNRLPRLMQNNVAYLLNCKDEVWN